jgi:glucose-6-phosphate 1-epimerase
LEQHGFARNKIWIVDEEAPPLTNGDNNNKASVDLLLKLSDDDLKFWPHWYDIDFFGISAFASP